MLEAKAEALDEREEALTAADEAQRLKHAAERAKDERKSEDAQTGREPSAGRETNGDSDSDGRLAVIGRLLELTHCVQAGRLEAGRSTATRRPARLTASGPRARCTAHEGSRHRPSCSTGARRRPATRCRRSRARCGSRIAPPVPLPDPAAPRRRSTGSAEPARLPAPRPLGPASDRLGPMATTEESARAEGAGGEAESGPVHGGKLVARALKSRGVYKLFTLSGGHLFSIYDGCKAEGIEIVDTRHEQAAAWAAEGYAKATRKPGIAALTAGPGVTNGMSAMAGAKFNRSPLVVLGGRAPEMRWGSGIAPGDRPPAVRLAGDQVGRDGQGDRRDPRGDRARDRHRADPAQRPDLRRLPARRRLHGGRGRGARADRRRSHGRGRAAPTRRRRCSPRPSAR